MSGQKIEKPMYFGNITLKRGLLLIIGFGLSLNVILLLVGGHAESITGILLQLFGFFSVFRENIALIKIYGMILLLQLLVSTALQILFFNAAGLVVMVINDVFAGLNLYRLHTLYTYLVRKSQAPVVPVTQVQSV